MEIVVGGRQRGKTHQLVEAAVLEKLRGSNAIIMVRSSETGMLEERVIRTLMQHGVRPRVLAKHQAKQIVRSPYSSITSPTIRDSLIYIDNLNLVLASVFQCSPYNIVMVTDNAPVRTPQGKRFDISLSEGPP